MDTGADATILAKNSWPSAWPLQPSLTHLQGIGQSKNTLQNSKILTWDSEGNSGTMKPFAVEALPVNLCGRDILSQMEVIMCSPNEIVTQQMLSQGFLPGQGLGKEGQGMPTPISVSHESDRTGLGYQSFS